LGNSSFCDDSEFELQCTFRLKLRIFSVDKIPLFFFISQPFAEYFFVNLEKVDTVRMPLFAKSFFLSLRRLTWLLFLGHSDSKADPEYFIR